MSSVTSKEVFLMGGKVAVITVIVVIIIALIFTWLYLQHVIEEYDLERAMNDATSIVQTLKVAWALT